MILTDNPERRIVSVHKDPRLDRQTRRPNHGSMIHHNLMNNSNSHRNSSTNHKMAWPMKKKPYHQNPHHHPVHAYQPPRLCDLQSQHRLKASKFFFKRFRSRPSSHDSPLATAPGAPLNTTSYIMRAKEGGGIACLASPIPSSPAATHTPVISPVLASYKGLADEANREWGVNGYGSMNGLIRLRSRGPETHRDETSESESDVEQCVQSVQQLEQRLDHDLSRFVLTYPSNSENIGPNLLETRMDDQIGHITHLEEENMTLREQLYVMQKEVDTLKRRMQMLEGGASCEQDETCSDEKSTASNS